MLNDLPPSVIYVDSGKDLINQIEMAVEDDDMLDPTAEQEAALKAAAAAEFQRRPPLVTLSGDGCDLRPRVLRKGRREQMSLYPGSNPPPLTPLAGGYPPNAASCSQASIPSTHLQVQYMEGMRRLSNSIRQTELTRHALRRQSQMNMSSCPTKPALDTSMHSLPHEMQFSFGIPPPPQMYATPCVGVEAVTRKEVFQWAATGGI